MNHASNNSIIFELEDYSSANTKAIGATLVVHYRSGAKGEVKKQMRTIKGSGGYRSYNQPIAHFGLGHAVLVDRLEIKWPDGLEQTIEAPFDAGNAYKIIKGR